MHIIKMTPNKAVAESCFKKSFLFDILSLTSCEELLYNSTLTCKYYFQESFVI